MFMALPRFFGANWRLFCGLILTVSIPAALLATVPLVFNWLPWGCELTRHYEPAVKILLNLLWMAALVYAAAQIKRNRPAGYKDSLGMAVKKWPRLLIIGILAIALRYAVFKMPYLLGNQDWTRIGIILCYVLAAYLVLRYLMLPMVLILENRSLWQSLKRSIAVTKGRALRVAGEFILLYITVIVVEQALTMALSALLGLFYIPGHGGLPATPVVQLPVLLLLMGIVKPVLEAFIPLGIFLMYDELITPPADLSF